MKHTGSWPRFRTAPYLALSSATWIQFILPYPIPFKSILILSSHLHIYIFQTLSPPLRFPHQHPVGISGLPTVCHIPHPISFSLICLSEQYLMKSNYYFHMPPLISSLSSSTLCSNLDVTDQDAHPNITTPTITVLYILDVMILDKKYEDKSFQNKW